MAERHRETVREDEGVGERVALGDAVIVSVNVLVGVFFPEMVDLSVQVLVLVRALDLVDTSVHVRVRVEMSEVVFEGVDFEEAETMSV